MVSIILSPGLLLSTDISLYDRYITNNGAINLATHAARLVLPGASVLNPFWRNLWKLDIPGKKKYIWRALHGILPLKSILANRHVGTIGECPICHIGAEDIHHLLLTCETAHEIWGQLGLSQVMEEAQAVDRAGSAVLEHLLHLPDNSYPGLQIVNLKETIIVAAWYLWWIRRRRTHNEDVPPMYKCKLPILTITANARKRKRRDLRDERWTRPEPRVLKVNVDVSFYVDHGAGSTGAVIRDFEGRLVAACCVMLPHVSSVAMAEVHAMKERIITG
jgi:hypothetical protein